MGENRNVARKAGSTVKTVGSKARSAVSGRRATKAAVKRISAGPGLKSSDVTKKKAPENPSSSARRPVNRDQSPVQEAASDLRFVATDDALVAEDVTVLQIARAVAEHRQGLMDRLAK